MFISEKDLFPYELSVVSVDELFDLENEILLDNIHSTDVAEIDDSSNGGHYGTGQSERRI